MNVSLMNFIIDKVEEKIDDKNVEVYYHYNITTMQYIISFRWLDNVPSRFSVETVQHQYIDEYLVQNNPPHVIVGEIVKLYIAERYHSERRWN